MRVIWPSGPYYPLHVFISSGCDSVLFEVLPMCKTSTRTKRAPWMEQTLTQALAAVKDGISQRDAADNFKIPRRTLCNHIKSGITKKSLGRKSVITVELEQDLVRHIIRYSEVGMPIIVPMLERYVYKFDK